MLFALERSDEAIESIQKSIELRPELVQSYVLLGEIHASRGVNTSMQSRSTVVRRNSHQRITNCMLGWAGCIWPQGRSMLRSGCKYLQDCGSPLAVDLLAEIDGV